MSFSTLGEPIETDHDAPYGESGSARHYRPNRGINWIGMHEHRYRGYRSREENDADNT